MENQSKFIMRLEWVDAVASLDKSERCDLYEMIFYYVATKKIKDDVSRNIIPIFRLIKNVIDYDTNKYMQRCETNRQNGLKGGKPVQKINEFSSKTQTKPNVTENITQISSSNSYKNQYIKCIAEMENIKDDILNLKNSSIELRMMKIDAFINMYASGSINYITDTEKLIYYYQMKDFKIDGKKITDFEPVVNYWKCDRSEYLKKYRKRWLELIMIAELPFPCAFTDFYRAQKSIDTLVITLKTMKNCVEIDNKVVENKDKLSKWFEEYNIKHIEYRLTKE